MLGTCIDSWSLPSYLFLRIRHKDRVYTCVLQYKKKHEWRSVNRSTVYLFLRAKPIFIYLCQDLENFVSSYFIECRLIPLMRLNKSILRFSFLCSLSPKSTCFFFFFFFFFFKFYSKLLMIILFGATSRFSRFAGYVALKLFTITKNEVGRAKRNGAFECTDLISSRIHKVSYHHLFSGDAFYRSHNSASESPDQTTRMHLAEDTYGEVQMGWFIYTL